MIYETVAMSAALLCTPADRPDIPSIAIDAIGRELPIPRAVADPTGFGCAVASTDHLVLVGVDGRRDGPRLPGIVACFEFEDGGWRCRQVISSPTATEADEFGAAISVHGDRLVVGSPGTSNERGMAWQFERSKAGLWQEPRPILAPEIDPGDRFGETVELAGDLAMIGIPRDDVEDEIDAGRVAVYDLSQVGSGLVARLESTTPNMGDRFGSSLAIGPKLAIGAIGGSAPGHLETAAMRSGVVHVFDSNPPFDIDAVLHRHDAEALDRTGAAMAYFDSSLVVGSPRVRTGVGRSGVVTMFDRVHRELQRPEHPDGGLGSSVVAMPPFLAYTVPGNRDETNRVDACIRVGVIRDDRFVPMFDIVGFGPAGTELVVSGDTESQRLVVGAPGRDEDGPLEGRAWTIDLESSDGRPRLTGVPEGSTGR